MEERTSVVPQSPLQKTLQRFVFEKASQPNPTIIITADTSTVEADTGHLPKTSLKLIQELIGKHTIQEALKQYKKRVSRLVSTKAPFTENDLKHFHQQVLREILSSFDCTYKDVLSSNPSLTQELQYERDKLKSSIKTQSRTFLASYENSIETMTRYLKDCTLEAENAYVEDMERSLQSVKSIGEIKLLHEDWKTKALQNFSDILRGKTSLEVEPWMTQELKSKLENKLEQIQEEFCDLGMKSTESKTKSIPTDYNLEKIVGNDKLKELIQKSAEKHASDKIKEFLQGNKFDKLIEDKHSNFLEEKLSQRVEDKLSNILEDKLSQRVDDKISNILEEKLSQLVEDKLSHILEEKLSQRVEDKLSNILEDKLSQRVDDKLSNILQDKLSHVEDNLSNIVQDVDKLVEEKFDKLVEDKGSDIMQEKLDKLVEGKVSKAVNEKTAKIVDQHLMLPKEFKTINDRVNAIQKENLGLKANSESVDNTLRAIQNDVHTKIGNMKDDNEKHSNILKNQLEVILKEHRSSNDYIKSVASAIKNDKGDYVDVVIKIAKLENDMKTFNEILNNQKPFISDIHQKLRSPEAAVQKQSPFLEHQHKNNENVSKLPSSQNNKISTANSTTKEPLIYTSETQVSKTSNTSTVSKLLVGGLAKSISPANNIVDGNANIANEKQMKSVVNSGVPKLQKQRQVTTAKVIGSERQTLVSRGHSTSNLVPEEKSNPVMIPILTIQDRKALLPLEVNNKKPSETQLQQTVKVSTASKSFLPRSVSTTSVPNSK